MTSWDDETDVIVAGSGGGLVGAYTAAREGLSVMVVEASDQFGGTTAYSGGGGMWFPCNPVLRRAGSDDTLDDAFAYGYCFRLMDPDRSKPNQIGLGLFDRLTHLIEGGGYPRHLVASFDR